MVARRRLLTSLKELLFGFGFVLLYAAGLPLLFTRLGMEWGFLPAWKLWGTRLLVVAPFLLLFLFWRQWQWITGRYRRAQAKLEREGTTYYLLPRADAPPVKAERITLWSRVVDVLPQDEHVSFEVIGAADSGVRFAMRAAPGVDRALLTQLMAEWPGTQARPVPAEQEPLAAPERAGWWCELSPHSSDRPIEAVSDDPLRALLAELARLPRGVQAGLQVLVRGDPFTRQRLGQQAARALYQQRGKAGDKHRLPATLEERRHTTSLDQRAQRAALEVRLVVWATAGSESMAQSVARSLARAVASQYSPANPLKVVCEGSGSPGARIFPIFAGHAWTDLELGALAHLVGQDARAIAPQLATAPANPLPPSPPYRIPRGARLSARLRVPPATPGAALDEQLAVVEEVA